MEEGKKRQQIIVGLAVIGVGLVLLALKHVCGLVQWASFFLLGGAFFAAYFYRREFGFLIPGCILLGLATHLGLRRADDPDGSPYRRPFVEGLRISE